MKVKATISFSGKYSMMTGEIRDIENKEILDDLIRAGYVEPVKEEKKKKAKT